MTPQERLSLALQYQENRPAWDFSLPSWSDVKQAGSDALTGVSRLPYRVLGAPVDLTNMVTSAFGAGDERPVGGSEWMIDKAINAGLAKPRSDSVAESAGDFTSGFLDPSVMGPKLAALAGKGSLAAAPVVAKVAKPSKAENLAAGLYHGIGGGVKLQKPVSEMKFATIDDPNMPLVARQNISPEEMHGGIAIPFVGDRSAAGKILTEVEGKPVLVPLEGGPDYMRGHAHDVPGLGGVWASDKGVVSRIVGHTRDLAEQGKPIYGTYTAMSPTSVDFNTMLANVLAQQLKSSRLKKGADVAFNEAVRAAPKGVGKDFVGVRNPKLVEQLLAYGNGNLRKAFADRMNLAEFRDLGFPDVSAARAAITEPSLIDVPLGSSGYSVAKVNPQGISTADPMKAHSTYNTQLAGDYVGGFDTQVPIEFMYPDFFKQRRAAGAKPGSDFRAFSMSNVSQPLNDEWLDSVMKYIESQKK